MTYLAVINLGDSLSEMRKVARKWASDADAIPIPNRRGAVWNWRKIRNLRGAEAADQSRRPAAWCSESRRDGPIGRRGVPARRRCIRCTYPHTQMHIKPVSRIANRRSDFQRSGPESGTRAADTAYLHEICSFQLDFLHRPSSPSPKVQKAQLKIYGRQIDRKKGPSTKRSCSLDNLTLG